jgi:hypothetical protein
MSRTHPDTAAVLGQTRAMLASCHRRVGRSALAAYLCVGLHQALVGLTVLAGACLLLRLAGHVVGWIPDVGGTVFSLLCVAVGVIPPAASVLRGLGRLPSLSAAAERLDLATQNHNRIATAMYLLTADTDSPFAQAAVQDGLERLRFLKDEEPRLIQAVWSWRRNAALMAGFAVMTAIAAIVGPPARFGKPGREGFAGVPEGRATPGPIEGKDRTTTQPVNQTKPTSRPAPQATLRRSGQMRASGRPAGREPGETTIGQASGGSQTHAGESRQGAGSQGDATDSASGMQSEKKAKNTVGKANPPKTGPTLSKASPAKAEEASSVSQGSGGGGAMLAVHNAWSQEAHTAPDEHEQEDADRDVEDQKESSTQRGGIQPSLKDRNEAPSRELGISEGQGPPGSGRGGPTPPKKSRGTASLVLGVPVPDFVRGRLAPGATKVTHERVRPSAMPGEPARSGESAARSLPENPDTRKPVPSPFARLVRDYLIALHTAGATGAGNVPSTNGTASEQK